MAARKAPGSSKGPKGARGPGVDEASTPGDVSRAGAAAREETPPPAGPDAQADPGRSADVPRSFGGLEDEYEILRELGRGGTAVVYLARDRNLGREVAIKVIRATYVEDEEAVARLQREARTVAQLQHPNIVMLYGTRKLDDNSLALVMQYVPGRPLKAVIRADGPLPFKMAAAILDDVSAALAYAHQRRIVHRDIKPENIYLDEVVEVARLADFGIARHWDADAGITLPGMAIGTPTYMSPEQIDGADLDGRSDIYSLGIVGYEMLTGQQPWAGENLYSIIYKQKREQLPRLEAVRPGVPEGMRKAIEGALHKRPGERWPSADHFLAALRGTAVEERIVLSGKGSKESVDAEGAPSPSDPGAEPPTSEGSADDHALTIRYRRPTDEAVEAAVEQDGAQALEEESESRWVPAEPELGARPQPRRTRSRFAVPVLMAALFAVVAFVAVRSMSPDPGLVAEEGQSPEVPVTEPRIDATTPTDGDPEAPSGLAPPAPLPVGLLAVGPSTYEGRPGGSTTEPIRVRAVTEDGSPAGEALVEFVVVSGDGRIDPPFGIANSEGVVEAGWTLGPGVEPDVVEARLAGVVDGPVVEFRARPSRTAADAPADDPPVPPGTGADLTTPEQAARGLDLVAGAGQRAAPLSGLPDPIRVRVVDSDGQPVEGVNVLFTPEAGHGSVTNRIALTGPDGIAETSWTLGSDEGSMRVAVAIAGAPGLETVVEATAVRAAVLNPRPMLLSGGTHNCALSAEGRAVCWGGNGDGQLGDGGRTRRSTPQVVTGTFRFARLSTGFSSTCGITGDGALYCWGRNGRGQLGDGSATLRMAPVQVLGGLQVAAVDVGSEHACASTAAGTTYCWGANDRGQLGDGTNTDRSAPTAVGGGRRFRSLTTGWNHTCAVSGNQTYCWGANESGQLGTGDNADASGPSPVAIGFGFTQLDAGAAHTCGVSASGVAYCWGSNRFGQLGDGSSTSQPTPVPVDGEVTFRFVATGPAHSCGLSTSGEAYCWGQNTYGQLGDGTITGTSVPTAVVADLSFASITVGGAHTCARTTNGVRYCWGYNSEGQIGDGTRENRTTPTRVRP